MTGSFASEKELLQVERYKGLLADEPKKLALKKAYVPQAPMSMFNHEEKLNVEQSATEAAGTMHSTAFRSVLGKDKRAVHKLNPKLDQSWYGSLHDAHLQ